MHSFNGCMRAFMKAGVISVPQTRWVYNFNGVDSYISTDIPLQNGDSIEFDFIASTSVGQGGSLLGRDSGLRLLWITDSARTISISSTASSATLDGNTIISGVTPWPDDNLVHVISISIVFSTNLTALGASGGGAGNFASLAIYNLKINDGSVYNFPINDRTFGAGAPIANSATVLGGERVINGDFDVDADWVKGVGWSIQNGRAELASDGTPQALIQDGVFTIGDTYIVEFDVFSDSSPIGFQDGSFLMVASGTSGRVKAVFVANTERLSFKRAFGSPVGWVDNVSVRKADGYATGINLLESGWTEIPL